MFAARQAERERIGKRDLVLTEYINTAMAQARYELLPDGTWFGEIPGFSGLWASAATEDACRVELRSTLEDWIVFSLDRHLPIPTVDGRTLTVREVA